MSQPLSPLEKDVSCRKDLLWRTNLDASVAADAFLAALARHDFVAAAGGVRGLAVLDHRDTGHRIILVTRTGRIQIRLDALTKHEERVQAAQSIFKTICHASLEVLGLGAGDPGVAANGNESQSGAHDAAERE